jgi:hypothetical protein
MTQQLAFVQTALLLDHEKDLLRWARAVNEDHDLDWCECGGPAISTEETFECLRCGLRTVRDEYGQWWPVKFWTGEGR